MTASNEIPRIEGIPSKDGAYWYYKRGAVLPSLVQVGTRDGERVIKDGSSVQRYWWPGEFFVGPIEPPFATPWTWRTPTERMAKSHNTLTR